MVRTALRLEGNVKRRHLAKYNNEVLEEKRLKFLFEKVIVAFVGTGRRLVRRRRQLLLLATSISEALVTINTSINMAFDPVEVRFLRFVTQPTGTFAARFRFKKSQICRLCWTTDHGLAAKHASF
jgi:hypothetical protein